MSRRGGTGRRSGLAARTAALVPLATIAVLHLPHSAHAQSGNQPSASQSSSPAPATCARADFEAVVDDAGETLRQLAQKNSPQFQAKLRALKEKRGWSNDEFMTQGAKFVRDERIASLEDRSTSLLAKINGAGNEAGEPTTVDCRRLDALKADMAALVAIQQEKWTYMFTNIETELAR